MVEPRRALARTGAALGAALAVAAFAAFWLGYRPAWFAVTGFVWGAILGTVSFALAAPRGRGGDSS